MSANDPVFICYDGSDDSANAIVRAGELLAGRRATVATGWTALSQVLLNASTEPATSWSIAEAVAESDASGRGHAERMAKEEGARLASDAGFVAQPLTLRADLSLWRALDESAAQCSAAVIVAGSRGLSRADSLLLGSVTDGLVNHSRTPILVVPGAATRAGAGPIAFCDDGSGAAGTAIDVGCRLLKSHAARVVRAHSPWEGHVPAYLPMLGAAVMEKARELDELARGQIADAAHDRAETVSARGFDCTAQQVAAEGSPWHGLLAAADADDAACLVVGTRGLTGLAAALGSVSHGVVHHSQRPVLVVPRKEDEPDAV